jgi:hypothetical protein
MSLFISALNELAEQETEEDGIEKFKRVILINPKSFWLKIWNGIFL